MDIDTYADQERLCDILDYLNAGKLGVNGIRNIRRSEDETFDQYVIECEIQVDDTVLEISKHEMDNLVALAEQADFDELFTPHGQLNYNNLLRYVKTKERQDDTVGDDVYETEISQLEGQWYSPDRQFDDLGVIYPFSPRYSL
jgi:hypothetical protein